jgi:hypothetical protein
MIIKSQSHILSGIFLFLLLGADSATAANPFQPVDMTPSANRIVGTWEAAARTGPCGGPFGPPFLAFTVFHAGGTLTETNMAPLGGIPTPFGQAIRGPAFGTWHYDPSSRTYTAQMRFNWFIDGFYHGYQQINLDRIELSPDDSMQSSNFNATRNFIDGTPPIPNCGEVSMVRIP